MRRQSLLMKVSARLETFLKPILAQADKVRHAQPEPGHPGGARAPAPRVGWPRALPFRPRLRRRRSPAGAIRPPATSPNGCPPATWGGGPRPAGSRRTGSAVCRSLAGGHSPPGLHGLAGDGVPGVARRKDPEPRRAGHPTRPALTPRPRHDPLPPRSRHASALQPTLTPQPRLPQEIPKWVISRFHAAIHGPGRPPASTARSESQPVQRQGFWPNRLTFAFLGLY